MIEIKNLAKKYSSENDILQELYEENINDLHN